jgi:hypothetical protein
MGARMDFPKQTKILKKDLRVRVDGKNVKFSFRRGIVYLKELPAKGANVVIQHICKEE